MGRRSTVEKLADDQFNFVIRAIIDGKTDREISAAFADKFDENLPKSSLNNWRNKAGDELAERYRLKRFQVNSFVEQLQKEGIEVGEDKYKHIIDNLEDHLLTAERDLIEQNPLKLLFARQEDERIKLKREKLELDKSQLEFDREKHKNQIDRVKAGAETMTDFLEFVGSDAEAISFLTRHLQPFGEHLKAKYAAQN